MGKRGKREGTLDRRGCIGRHLWATGGRLERSALCIYREIPRPHGCSERTSSSCVPLSARPSPAPPPLSTWNLGSHLFRFGAVAGRLEGGGGSHESYPTGHHRHDYHHLSDSGSDFSFCLSISFSSVTPASRSAQRGRDRDVSKTVDRRLHHKHHFHLERVGVDVSLGRAQSRNSYPDSRTSFFGMSSLPPNPPGSE